MTAHLTDAELSDLEAQTQADPTTKEVMPNSSRPRHDNATPPATPSAPGADAPTEDEVEAVARAIQSYVPNCDGFSDPPLRVCLPIARAALKARSAYEETEVRKRVIEHDGE